MYYTCKISKRHIIKNVLNYNLVLKSYWLGFGFCRNVCVLQVLTNQFSSVRISLLNCTILNTIVKHFVTYVFHEF